jgi:arginase family enzyme
MKTPTFLDSGYPNAPAAKAFFHVIPAPMETTVSYGGGTAKGPRAILEASGQLEDFDGHGCPGDLGIHTQAAVKPAAGKKSLEERWIDAIEAAVAKALRCGAVPVVLGGEHTVTQAAARAFQAVGADIGFIHFDAHADLRDAYEGTKYSHACVMRRVHELGFPIVQLGTRAYCKEEAGLPRGEPEDHHRLRRRGDCRREAAEELDSEGIPEAGLHHVRSRRAGSLHHACHRHAGARGAGVVRRDEPHRCRCRHAADCRL